MRFLLDENVHGDTTFLLRDLGHDIIHVADSEWPSQPDELLIRVCNEQNRICNDIRCRGQLRRPNA